ncbi:MAG: hypothetical protein IKI57_07235 [Clostridia bacterium]|nr:hypothetical protein [Clostridia bacterium]
MNYYIDSKRYINEEKQKYLNQGIFINDLRGYDGSEKNSIAFIASIEPSVFVNHVGSIMTKENIFEVSPNIGGFDMKVVDFEAFSANNVEVYSIIDL